MQQGMGSSVADDVLVQVMKMPCCAHDLLSLVALQWPYFYWLQKRNDDNVNYKGIRHINQMRFLFPFTKRNECTAHTAYTFSI